MRKVYTKLFLTVISLLVSATMVLSASYAWLVLSQSPAVNGISVMIGGGKTILFAADVTKTVTDEAGNSQTLHYPGKFSDTLNISAHDTYAYLNECSGLMPVSTADGRYWMIPQYDENGGLLPVEQFAVDDKLSYANQKEDGCYIYLDFWVVSPGSEYDIHVSMDKQEGQGSYLVELPEVGEGENGGLTLVDPQGIVPASARVGFLVSSEKAHDADMTAYIGSENYDTRYSGLLGVYQEPGEQINPVLSTRFTIYEPNGMPYPSDTEGTGGYQITNPLGYDPFNPGIGETDISDRLTVQTESRWDRVQLEQQFQTAVIDKTGISAAEAKDYFYTERLQGQISEYLSSGLFVRDTGALYHSASERVETAGASDGIVVTRLGRNTPQRIRMYIWLEGQDADCRNDSIVNASQIALKIELAGSTP